MIMYNISPFLVNIKIALHKNINKNIEIAIFGCVRM